MSGATALALAIAVGWAWACGLPRPAPPNLLEGFPASPPEIRSACDLTQKKCTRCHTIDRVRLVHVSSPAQWGAYVARMRRQAGSGISPADGDVILRCLVYRTGGSR